MMVEAKGGKRDCRIGIRLTAEERDLLQRASSLRGQTLTQFLISAALVEAGRDPEQFTLSDPVVVLDDGERANLLKILEHGSIVPRSARPAIASHRRRVTK
jgi:uncharacterized protein (DUF1778 family)